MTMQLRTIHFGRIGPLDTTSPLSLRGARGLPNSMLSIHLICYVDNLGFKGEAGTDLVGGLVQVLCVEAGTETESDTSAELDVVGKGSETTVVDLGLLKENC